MLCQLSNTHRTVILFSKLDIVLVSVPNREIPLFEGAEIENSPKWIGKDETVYLCEKYPLQHGQCEYLLKSSIIIKTLQSLIKQINKKVFLDDNYLYE